MATIDIYTKQTCPFCHRAKALLEKKGAAFNEIAIDGDVEKRAGMIERSGRSTVPQIFIDGKHIGGCDDLYALEAEHGLDPLLQAWFPGGTNFNLTGPSNMSEQNNSEMTFQIQRVYTKDISFEAPNAPQVFQKEW